MFITWGNLTPDLLVILIHLVEHQIIGLIGWVIKNSWHILLNQSVKLYNPVTFQMLHHVVTFENVTSSYNIVFVLTQCDITMLHICM